MARPVWFVNLLKRFFPDRFRLAKLTRWPMIGKIVDSTLFRGDEIVYLTKDNIIPVNIDFGEPTSTVLPSHIVDHFIQSSNHLWIMDFCICREGDDCQNYPKDFGCIFLGEAVHQINPKLGRLVSKSEALEHAHRCREAGLVHMIGRNRLDSVWLGATPNTNLLTICNCCPCCCLWKMLPDLAPEIGDKITGLPGVNVLVTDECMGCGDCQDGVCFVNAIQIIDGQAVIDESCRGCGRCVEVCPTDAIEINLSQSSYVDDVIAQLAPLVDLT